MRTELEKLFGKFVSIDETRPSICSSWILNGYAAATNGHVLLYVPEEKVDFIIEKKPDVDDNRPELKGLFHYRNFMPFSIGRLIHALSSKTPEWKIESDYLECEVCFGEGEFEIDEYCSHCRSKDARMAECDVCNGSGLTKEPNPLAGQRRYESTKTLLQLPKRSITVDWKYLNLLKEVMDFYGGNWEVSNQSKTNLLLFYCKRESVYVGVMPMRED